MKYNFLLDTSAFRALSKNILYQLKIQDHKIFASPYSFWELLSHLDEKDKFEYYKNNILKFDFVQILDDPRAEFESPILTNDNEFVERISDHELINGLLNALENSYTLNAFYSSYIKDSKGQIRLISDCSKRVREVLDGEEIKYTEFHKNIIGAFKSGQAKVENIYDHHERILELVNGRKIDLINRGALKNRLADEVIKGTYIYYAYIFYRALNNFKINNFRIDKNDFEDVHICFHIKLNTNYYLITSDKRMKTAIDQTIRLINQIENSKIYTSLQVNDIKFIKTLVNT